MLQISFFASARRTRSLVRDSPLPALGGGSFDWRISFISRRSSLAYQSALSEEERVSWNVRNLYKIEIAAYITDLPTKKKDRLESVI